MNSCFSEQPLWWTAATMNSRFNEQPISPTFSNLQTYFLLWVCCAAVFPCKEGGIQVLAGLAPSSQTIGSLLRTPWLAKPATKIWQNVSSPNSLQWKNPLNYFWLNKLRVFIVCQSRIQPTKIRVKTHRLRRIRFSVLLTLRALLQ